MVEQDVEAQDVLAGVPSGRPTPPPPEPPSNHFVAAASIAAYCTVSLSIVYFNWWLFTGRFRYPVFVSWVQQVVGFAMLNAFGLLGSFVRFFKIFPSTCLEPKTAMNVLPLAANFVGMVGLANLCLKFVQVSTYQVARSLTIFFTMGLSYLLLGESQSLRTKVACATLVLGFGIGSLDTKTLSVIGVLSGASSSVFQALYNVMIKRTLPVVNGDTNALLLYNVGISSVLFLPIIFVAGEGKAFLELPGPNDSDFFIVWASLLVSGLLATMMNLASYVCVKATSPLTFNIVGITKSIVQTVGGILFLGDVVTGTSLLGILLSLVGSAWYSIIKLQETKARDAAVRVDQSKPLPLKLKPLPLKLKSIPSKLPEGSQFDDRDPEADDERGRPRRA